MVPKYTLVEIEQCTQQHVTEGPVEIQKCAFEVAGES